MARDKNQPMPRTVLRDQRPPEADPDSEEPGSLRVRHYRAMARLVQRVSDEPPTVPNLDKKVFEVVLPDSDNAEIGLHILATRDDDNAQLWAAIKFEDEEGTPYIPLNVQEDIEYFYKNLMYDHLADHEDARFFCPVDGPRVRRDTRPEDDLLLWYWYDVIDLKIIFQIADSPTSYYDDDDLTKISVYVEDVEKFLFDGLANELSKLREAGLSRS